MIRVLHFADIINRNDFIHTVLESCNPRTYLMSAATMKPAGTLNGDPRGIPVANFDTVRLWQFPAAVAALRRLIRRERIDVVHAHHFIPGLIAMAASNRQEQAFVIGRHYSDAIYRLSTGPRRRAYLALEAMCNSKADAIVAPAQAVESVLVSQGVDRKKIVRIPYGFAFERYEAPADTSEARLVWGAEPGLRLATFARLHPEKGHAFLLAALAALAQQGIRTTWVIAGDGPARGSLERLVDTAGLRDRTHFLGWRTDVPALMSAADLIVQPTLHEAFSQVMVEAMAFGRPLVITDVSGVRDIVEDGTSGLIVPPSDSGALSRAIDRLRDLDLRARIGKNARQVVRARLDIRSIAPRYEDLYQTLVKRRAS